MKLSQLIKHPGAILASWFVFVFVMVVILPTVASNASLNGLNESIDTNFSFDPSLIYSILDNYGSAGRAYYVLQRWSFDLVWPIIYGVPLYLTLNRLITRSNKWISIMILSPLIAVLLDYVENIIFTILALAFPLQMEWLTVIGVSVSLLKWVLLSFAMILVFFACLIAFSRFIKIIKTKT